MHTSDGKLDDQTRDEQEHDTQESRLPQDRGAIPFH